jgi:hypothetical protein
MLNFCTAQLIICHGLTPMGHGMLLGHPNIIQRRCMDDMKLSGGKQQNICYHTSKQCEFWPRFAVKVPNFCTAQLKICHGLTPMGHGMLLGHPNIIQRRCMDDMFRATDDAPWSPKHYSKEMYG